MRWDLLKRKLTPYLFCAPFMIIFAIFFIAPLVYAARLSLFRETMVGGVRFAGAHNYLRALADQTLWTGIGNVLVFGAILIPVLLVSALVLALLLDSRYAVGRPVLQVSLLLPYAIPGVMASLIWVYLYGPSFGPFAQMATGLGLPRPPFLSREWVPGSLANIALWNALGYNMIIIYAALKAISPELREAAYLDGASDLQFAYFVKIPLVAAAILLNAIFGIIGTLQLFSEPQIMSILAPHIVNSGYTPNMYVRTLAFVHQDFNYSAAVSFVLAAVIGIISGLVVFGARRRVKGGN